MFMDNKNCADILKGIDEKDFQTELLAKDDQLKPIFSVSIWEDEYKENK